MIIGGIITVSGLSIMFTPLRTYFLIGWITGAVLLCNGLVLLGAGLSKRKRSLSKSIVGAVTALVGVILLATDMQQILTQIIIVYLVAGGIMFSGFIECIIGYSMVKKGKKGLPTLITGGISFAVGLGGLIYQETTVVMIGLVVGYHIVRIGLNIVLFARDMNKPTVIDLNG